MRIFGGLRGDDLALIALVLNVSSPDLRFFPFHTFKTFIIFRYFRYLDILVRKKIKNIIKRTPYMVTKVVSLKIPLK